MKVAVMQPYFFPYIGYFQLIQAADRFFICDEVQYIRHGWINRNRIYKSGQDTFSYIIMPVAKHPHTASIKDVRCVEGKEWKDKILEQIKVYRKTAPHYKEVRALLQHCLQCQHRSVSKLNVYFLQQVIHYIGLNKTIAVHTGTEEYTDRTDRPVAISKSAGATTYINMIGGKDLYDGASFMKRSMQLCFLKPVLSAYPQGKSAFNPGLSIIDAMMYNTPAELKTMINEFEIVPA